MCGRFTHLYRWSELHRLMTLTSEPVDIRPRYNVAPSQEAPVVVPDAATGPPGRALKLFRWGLVPSWAEDPRIGNTMINARAEGLQSRRAFGPALRSRRCIVPISGFYEWSGTPRNKRPHYISGATGDPLLLAGLWERWTPQPTAPPLQTFTIITTAPNAVMARLHDRMPAILNVEQAAMWLDASFEDASRLTGLLAPCGDDVLTVRPVSPRVNSPRHDDPGCVDDPPPAAPTLFG